MDKHDKKILKDGEKIQDKDLEKVVGGMAKIINKPIAHK